VGLSIYARKGYDATEMRSRGAAGNVMCGRDAVAASPNFARLATKAAVAEKHAVSRNARRVALMAEKFARAIISVQARLGAGLLAELD